MAYTVYIWLNITKWFTLFLFDTLPYWTTATWVWEESSEMANGSGIWGMANAYPMDSRDSDREHCSQKFGRNFSSVMKLKYHENEFRSKQRYGTSFVPFFILKGFLSSGIILRTNKEQIISLKYLEKWKNTGSRRYFYLYIYWLIFEKNFETNLEFFLIQCILCSLTTGFGFILF